MISFMSDNLLYYGDNLDVLRRHGKDESVDQVYLGPPFKSNQDTNVLFAERDGTRAVGVPALAGVCSPGPVKAGTPTEDTWRWDRGWLGSSLRAPRTMVLNVDSDWGLADSTPGTRHSAFHDVVQARGRVAQAMIAFRTFLGENPGAPGLAYLANMAPRPVELRRMLKHTPRNLA